MFAERGLPTNLVPSRDIGLQIGGDFSEGLFAYQVGVFNGVADLANGGDDLSDAKDFAARVFVQPFKSGSFDRSASALPRAPGSSAARSPAPVCPPTVLGPADPVPL